MEMKTNRKLRIAHVVAVFPPYWSGTGNVAYYNALELGRLGHEIHVFTAGYPLNGYKDPSEITVHRIWTPFRLGNAPLTPSLLTLLNGFDLIHLHWPFIFGAELTWLASVIQKVPYVMTYHIDLRGDRKWVFGPYQSLWGHTLANRAKKVIAVSRDHLASSQIYSVMKGRLEDVVEIPNGVDPQRFHPDIPGRPVRACFGIPDEHFVILFVGAMDSAHEYKGVPDLLQAFGQLDDKHAWLLLVGSGDLLASYQHLTYQRIPVKTRSRVIFSGSVPHQDLPPYYAASDVCVLPSRHTESFGMVLIEAMACGKPVIATNIPGVSSVVDNGVDGLLIPPAEPAHLLEKIKLMMDKPSYRHEMGKQGRKKVLSKYTWGQIAMDLSQVYQDLV